LNPRPKSLATRSLHACPIHFASGLTALGNFAGTAQSGQETLPASPIDLAAAPRTERRQASPLNDASIRVRGHARGDGLR